MVTSAALVPFAGRQRELASLAAFLDEVRAAPAVAVLRGPGGVGKTALALRLLADVADRWCYGTVGIARAQQLAALATEEPGRQQAAEDALAASLTETQLDRITESNLCHGIAGVYQTAYRASRDARGPALADRLPALADRLVLHARSLGDDEGGGEADASGLLTGRAGVGLALETARHATPPHTGWDACLLIT